MVCPMVSVQSVHNPPGFHWVFVMAVYVSETCFDIRPAVLSFVETGSVMVSPSRLEAGRGNNLFNRVYVLCVGRGVSQGENTMPITC